MAITILDVDWDDSIFGGKAPQMMFDFNPPKSENNTEKLHRIVTGRISALTADTLTADELGLRSIRSIVFQVDSHLEVSTMGGVNVAGSISDPGSIDNSVTITMKANIGTILANPVASTVRLSYFASGDR